jgi:hypothetical protein
MLETSLKANAMGKILTVNNYDTGKFPIRLLGMIAAPCCSSLFVPGSPQAVDSYPPIFRFPFLYVRPLAESKF